MKEREINENESTLNEMKIWRDIELQSLPVMYICI